MTSDLFGDLPEQPALTDEQLREMGLKPVRSFIRTDASKAALRTAKHRAKLEEEGRAQLNVVAPLEAHELVKELTRRITAGEDPRAVLSDLAGSQNSQLGKIEPPAPAPARKVDVSPAPTLPEADALVVAAAHAPGLRGWLIRRLAGV
jgi:hypothetical protein|uniref:Uncharacterized protein n=1 Tax=uncultured prokaryote TaxID=198431 RepID=A0A0H5Q7H7_9ZZZZ|nr:hypothetical protein [uncultured prokaryote]